MPTITFGNVCIFIFNFCEFTKIYTHLNISQTIPLPPLEMAVGSQPLFQMAVRLPSSADPVALPIVVQTEGPIYFEKSYFYTNFDVLNFI
jgi:hypothetical protein